ncbi:MAG: hypothetical protein ACYC3I_20735 [Gemmataceae bacterium]
MTMMARWSQVAAVLAGFLLVSLGNAKFTFAPRQHKDMKAVLTVEAGKTTAERGLGEATLTLTIAGPSTLDVEEPRLGDAAAAWKEERLAGTREVQNQRAVWSQVIRLKQVKRGLEPMPDLTVRFRRDPDADWIEEKWIDILRNVRAGMEPPRPEEEGPSWLRRWGFVLILAATAVLVLWVWLNKRKQVRRLAPLSPERWALREIARIERTLTPPRGAAETYHTQMSYVTRRYLAERFGVHALQQTTAEFRQAVRQISQLSAEEHALLAELFERCDLAKFARAGAAPEECQRTSALACELVRRTSRANARFT